MCFYCDRKVKGGNPRYWWYLNFVCWTCRVQNGIFKSNTEKQDIKNERSNKYYESLQYTNKTSSSLVENENYSKKEINKNGCRVCYKCNQLMTNVGVKFKTPKKNNIKKWKNLQKVWENQFKYDKNGNSIYVGPKNRVVEQNF
jgi:hypothetical protein